MASSRAGPRHRNEGDHRLGHQLLPSRVNREDLGLRDDQRLSGLQDRGVAPKPFADGGTEKMDLELGGQNHFVPADQGARRGARRMVGHRRLDARVDVAVLLEVLRRDGDGRLAPSGPEVDEREPKVDDERRLVEEGARLITVVWVLWLHRTLPSIRGEPDTGWNIPENHCRRSLPRARRSREPLPGRKRSLAEPASWCYGGVSSNIP